MINDAELYRTEENMKIVKKLREKNGVNVRKREEHTDRNRKTNDKFTESVVMKGRKKNTHALALYHSPHTHG